MGTLRRRRLVNFSNWSTGCNRMPLPWAAENWHKEGVWLLVEKGAELDSKDKYGRTALLWAAENGHEAVVQLLLEEGAEPDSKNSVFGRTPLLWAVENGHEAVVLLLSPVTLNS
jgi:ankyrin repeat protein